MSFISIPKEVAIPVGSLILVTGVNGYIGAHVADQLLKRGYRVRGIVRRKTDWLTPLFSQRYGKGSFEIYQISDVADASQLQPAMKDVSGVLHLASDVSFSPDPTIVLPTAINLATFVLTASSKSPSVTRFILCSSSTAAASYKPNIPHSVSKTDYSDDYISEASQPGPYGPDRAISTYGASKALAEKAVWAWANENKDSGIVVNTVLPDFNIGLPISPEHQGWPSSVGILKLLFEGDVEHGRMLPPQHAVAVQDTALLHVAALLHPEVRGERVFAYAEPKTANRVLEVFGDLYPERKFAGRDEGEGEELTEVLQKPRAEELLRWVAGRSWITFEESLRECGDYFIAHEKAAA